MIGRFVLVGCLFTVSLMWPSEGANSGDGLHWAILWLAAAAFGCWQAVRSGEAASAQEQSWQTVLSRIAPFVVVAGVWVSTAYVFEIQADRRTALNVAFEWTAILAASVLFWQWPAAAFRDQFGRLVVGLALGFAIMGILQHHVVWEQRADWYLERMAAIENWEQTGFDAAAAKQAEGELLAEQVPLTGSAAETFRRRLLDSTEAIGPFALANTLGGFLAAGLVLLIGMIHSAHAAAVVTEASSSTVSSSSASKPNWKSFILAVLWALVIGYALVLTKSRTAWVAAGVGIFWLLNGMRRKSVNFAEPEQEAGGDHLTADRVTNGHDGARRPNGSFGKTVVVVCLIASGLFVAGVAGGAIDREVLFESPRSLRFRLMYWMGTSDLLADHALFGTGPGNFRNTYLQYKLADSSEQILDPHNLPLDAYCSAGLLGLVGLLLLLGTAFLGRARSRCGRPDAEQFVQPRQQKWRCGAFISVAGGATVSFVVWEWFNGADLLAELAKLPDGGLLVLAIPAAVVLVTVTMVQRWSVERTVFQAAFATLLVHLMGAGAFQITAVGLVLICLHRGSCDWFVVAAERDVRGDDRVSGRRFQWFRVWNCGGLVAFGFLAAVIVVYGLIPVRAAQRAFHAGRMAEASGRMELAVSILNVGISADEFDVKLRQRKAELLAYSLIAGISGQEDSALNSDVHMLESQRVIAACDDWSHADSTGYRQFVLRSEVLESLWKLQQEKDQMQSAISAMSEAVDRYPTNAESLSRLALLQKSAGLDGEARTTASTALQQDGINRNWGHAELYLDDASVEQLNQILK